MHGPVCELTLKFDRFGERALHGVADGQGRTLEAVLVDALAHFDAPEQRRRLSAVPPRFLAERVQAELSVRLATCSSRLERLQGDARRREVPVERLLEHALLLYLADVGC
jgi:hypothetical protein